MFTPSIFFKRSEAFETELYEKFRLYCDLMKEMCCQLGSEVMRLVFYLSSVAVVADRSNNFEYTLAQQFWELHIEVISKQTGFKRLVESLLRLETDQKDSRFRLKSQDFTEFALKIEQNNAK